MKIFVAYGYNDRDRWVENLVFPIIRAFSDEIVTGEELAGEQITDAVIRKIRQSDAMIAFATRRGDPIGTNRWLTHRWVTDEISQALANNIPVIEVREDGVDAQGGIAGDRQSVPYDENRRERCLVDLVTAIGRWHRERQVELKLLPDEFAQKVFPYLRRPDLRCTYSLLNDDEQSEEKPARILPIKGGLFVRARGVLPEALIQIHVECSGESWTSSFESTDSLSITLRQD